MSKKPEYYVLTPVYPTEPGEFVIANASVGTCQLCGGIATGMGGSNRDVCLRCAEVIMNGKARGAIVWADDGESHQDRRLCNQLQSDDQPLG